MRHPLLLVLIFGSACQASLPNVEPSQFTCDNDDPDSKGNFPCPEASFCGAGKCTPRFDCFVPNAGRPGCDPDQTCETTHQMCRRCDATFNTETDAVSCQGGVHTTTSTRPKDLPGCTCPDGTYCVAFQDTQVMGDAFPLFVFPTGMAVSLPIRSLELTAEKIDFRYCVRVCGSELDCPANHTCRAAAVVSNDLIQNPSSTRHTIGVCYPDAYVVSSTTAKIPAMPDASACWSDVECANRGNPGPCRYEILSVPDHPSVPANTAWNPMVHRALVARCADPASTSTLKSFDVGCTRGDECRSGLCVGGRCAKTCNPHIRGTCPLTRGCNDVRESRELPGTGSIEDRVQICGAP
jgi:hypothetical protein